MCLATLVLLHMWIWRAVAGLGGPADVMVVARLTRECIGCRIDLIVLLFEIYVFQERIHVCKNVLKKKDFAIFCDSDEYGQVRSPSNLGPKKNGPEIL